MELSNESSIITDCNSDHNLQSLPLANDIDKLSDRLNKISINETSFIKNLEEWRNEAHEIIDKFCKLKFDEYERRTKEELDRLHETLNLLSSDHDDAAEDYIDWVKETIQSIHQQLDEFQQIQLKFSPLKIENSLICLPPEMSDLKRQPTPLKDLFSFSSSTTTDELISPLSSSSSPFNCIGLTSENTSSSFSFNETTIQLPSDHWYSLAVNEKYLLVIGKSNLFLIDHSLKIINKKSFLQIGIKDICWSKILSRFILISPKEIFILNEKNLTLESCSINLIDNYTWERGTTSQMNLFISTYGENPFIVEYNLLPSIHFNKRYQSSMICGESEIINDIKANESSLALIIDNGFTNESRFELRSIKSFECIYSIQLGRGWGYRCSPFQDYSPWIIADSYNQRLIHVKHNGTIDKIENYSTKPLNVTHWNDDQIVIRTVEGLNIHQCK